jgi:hypothetical protein
VAGAATKSTKVSKTTITSVANPRMAGKPDHVAELTTLLSTLVTKGTITQSQADAIIAAAKTAEAARDALRPEMGPKGGIGGALDQKLTVVATTLGLDTTTVLTRLQAGETLATIAGTKKDALIAALVADETKRIDAAVTAGTLTAAQATTLKANLVAHVTAEVNSPAPAGPKMGGRDDRGGMKGGSKGDRGHGGPKGGMSGAPAIPAPAATTASN